MKEAIAPRGKEVQWKAAPALVVAAGVCWGIIGLFSYALKDAGLSAMQIAALRCLAAGVTLGGVLLIRDPGKLRVRLRDLWMFMGTGVISFALFNVCYFLCMQQSTLAVSVTLLYTGPCFVMILSCILFHERFTAGKGTAILLSVLGCALVTGLFSQGGCTGTALLIGLCSGFGYALYSIFGQVALAKYHELTVVTYTFLFASLALMPFVHLPQMLTVVLTHRAVLGNTLLLGLVSTLTPFLLYTKGLRHMETGKASMLTFVEPVVATLLSCLVFREAFHWNHALGIAAILAAMIILNLPSPTKSARCNPSVNKKAVVRTGNPVA